MFLNMFLKYLKKHWTGRFGHVRGIVFEGLSLFKWTLLDALSSYQQDLIVNLLQFHVFSWAFKVVQYLILLLD